MRKEVVKQIESGELRVYQACRIFEIKSPQTVYNWLNKYSRTLKTQTRIVVENNSVDKRLKELEARTKELEAALGRKQLEADLYRHIVDLASEEYKVDLKKSFGARASKGK
ncbi:helix-turn-helix domain-containing protein [Croceimicrobium hydrocarbonivorans]|uniref:Helix-turn-helix domain-containing protein n=1 Tax=Croceimicrobium hydrocarbonivorans TaxID=2761580 RepID=A0A7H0VJ62_9FLAO|nr:helix-turn-helix domain-containing protein [Croceimicrobium hydrocarbonivorans]QNR25760.1 helix-turn-helix domain-containing protein [Croceimicrobium hydrocarbonivorans]